MKSVLPAAALVLVGGAAAILTSPGLLRAGDESPHDAVERLMPQLMSEDDAVRADAERSLFGVGDAGRAELERITREADPRRAVTALRLLQSSKWPKSVNRGEQRVHRDGVDVARDNDDSSTRDDPFSRIDSLRDQLEEMRKRFEQFDQSWELQPNGVAPFGPGVHGRSSGTINENDKKTTWTVDEDGRIKVTLKDGKDAPEQSFEAKDFDELRKTYPDAAKRVEPMLGGGGRSFSFRLGPQGAAPQTREFFRAPNDRSDPFQLDAPQTQVLGIEWGAVPDVLREQLDLGTGGMVVESVVPDSLASKLGLARFDVLVEVDGKPVAGSPDVRAALENAKAGDKVTAVVVRKGQKKSLETTK